MAGSPEPTRADDAIAEFLNSMTGGQCLILAEAIRQLGGELRIRPQDFAAAAKRPLPSMEVEGTDGVVVLRLSDPRRGAVSTALCHKMQTNV
ncbi:hypothetical protein EON82_22320 [bacterium]|nr:MAG: hypothetical protein EON82_22320 [bacterium]